ncbi:uncharacterized protein LOC126474383 [Schistocerca serialis cubense]|uniref:uncharacterized protein LOC126474383 n=1 Tax=Schistocerca serialis cubense TaxID=2023355 RepID=UPI00214EABA0|nr:uncharacterized protein LOC126474383 [Schistocerca serialis cubense]
MHLMLKRKVDFREKYIDAFPSIKRGRNEQEAICKVCGFTANGTAQPLQLASGATRAPQEDDASSPPPSPLADPMDLHPPSPSPSAPQHMPLGLDVSWQQFSGWRGMVGIPLSSTVTAHGASQCPASSLQCAPSPRLNRCPEYDALADQYQREREVLMAVRKMATDRVATEFFGLQ